MDRALLETHVKQNGDHIALGDRLIDRQRRLVDTLAHTGHDTTQALALLAEFEQIQRGFIIRRAWLEDESKAYTKSR